MGIMKALYSAAVAVYVLKLNASDRLTAFSCERRSAPEVY
jgi:hypothetical protein